MYNYSKLTNLKSNTLLETKYLHKNWRANIMDTGLNLYIMVSQGANSAWIPQNLEGKRPFHLCYH